MLKTVNLSRGSGNEAFVLAIAGTPPLFHSEKHFSLGELCVLKLLRYIREVSNHSLIIIDELEMALHPRAQVRLLRHLEEQARVKSLTVLFSTHSVTLLKTISRRQIIYLEKQDNGDTVPVYGCFPTYAIGNIAADEETLPDLMLYVEDLFARDITTAFIEKYTNDRFLDPTMRPTAKIVPVGGFQEVVAFLDRNRSVLPDHCVQRAILDEDVSTETQQNWRTQENHSQLAKFDTLKQQIKFLPFTPEVGIMEYAASNLTVLENAIRVRCADNQLRLGDFVRAYDTTLQGRDKRTAAKRAVSSLLDYLSQRTQKPEDIVRDQLCGVFANLSWRIYRPDFMRLFGQMIQ
jgi:hypothetical protein